MLNIKSKKNKVKFIVRKNNPGLTASIIDGIMSTTTKYFVVMDSDLQREVDKAGLWLHTYINVPLCYNHESYFVGKESTHIQGEQNK